MTVGFAAAGDRLAVLHAGVPIFGGYTCTELAVLLGQSHAAITRQICSGLQRLHNAVVATGPALAGPSGAP